MSVEYLEYYGIRNGLGDESSKIDNEQKPAKKTSNMSGSFKKFNTAQNRTLWQIFWKQDQDSDSDGPNLTMVDASIGQRAKSRLEREQNEILDESDEEVVYESKDSEVFPPPKPPRAAPVKPFNENEWTSMDLGEPHGEFTGQGLSRKDSDTDLMLGGPPHGQYCARLRWCFLNCRNPLFWRRYWWVPIVLLLAIAIYVAVTLIFVKTL